MESKRSQTTGPGSAENSAPPSITAFLGVLLLISGAGTYLFNYERQTMEAGDLETGQTIIRYYAPTWDPLPHHVQIVADPQDAALFAVSIDIGQSSETETLLLGGDKEVIDVYPGETISIAMERVNDAEGVIKTVLWCDSWNYAAAILSGIGAILLIRSRWAMRRQKSPDQD